MAIFGALLIAVWIVLLIRYPQRVVPVLLGGLLVLGCAAAWLVLQSLWHQRDLQRVQLEILFDDSKCPPDQPLSTTLTNGGKKVLRLPTWQLEAYRPGETVNLVENRYANPDYSGPSELLPGSSWQSCMPSPALRSGYRARSLEFRAVQLQAEFSR